MKPTILIVEDNSVFLESLRDYLSGVFSPHCHVLAVQSGEEAVELARARPPDVVLVDVRLPQMNGFEATRRIKAASPRAFVVMLSIHEEPAYQAKAIAAGANAFMPKSKMHTHLGGILALLTPVVADLLSQAAKPAPEPHQE